MKVRATTVEQHRFATRRRGYDRAEVDAVMGRLSHSLRNYEQEMGDLEARLEQAICAEITDPRAQRAREEQRENPHMESERMMTQAEEALTGARRQAESILASARTEIEKLFEDLEGETRQVLAAAEQQAAEMREEADRESKATLVKAEEESERLRAEAASAKSEAEAERQAAQAEGVRIRDEAAREAASVLESARREHDRLATRIPELRTALSQFEAQVHALAAEPVVDLNAVEAAEREVAPETDQEPAIAEGAEEADLSHAIPVPDGSGNLPAARDLVDLDEYRELKASPVPSEAAAADSELDETTPAEPATAELEAPPLERLAGSHVATRGIPGDNETIYQRRGGGLRRRIKAQGDQE